MSTGHAPVGGKKSGCLACMVHLFFLFFWRTLSEITTVGPCGRRRPVSCSSLSTSLIGERSEPSVGRWMENLVLPCMAVCSIYIYRTFITQRVHRRFYGLTLKTEKVLENSLWRLLD